MPGILFICEPDKFPHPAESCPFSVFVYHAPPLVVWLSVSYHHRRRQCSGWCAICHEAAGGCHGQFGTSHRPCLDTFIPFPGIDHHREPVVAFGWLARFPRHRRQRGRYPARPVRASDRPFDALLQPALFRRTGQSHHVYRGGYR
ncbi:conserved hypothetical protein, partial [Ricinus communis]